MPSPFTIHQAKEGSTPKKSLFLVKITAVDGDVCRLTTTSGRGVRTLTYDSVTWDARIQRNDIEAIVAMGPQGYDSVSGFTLTIADADKSIWTNHCLTHGWKGASVQLVQLMYDLPNNQFSTDAVQWNFICGNPQHDNGRGETTVDVISAVNYARIKVPSIPLEFRCPWDFPTDADSRLAGAIDFSSVYYQCGYSPDVSGGVGNYESGTTCFTTCDKTRAACMARMGNSATTSVAPDGDLEHDRSGRYTGRFGGVTWLAPREFSGTAFVTGQKTFGYNQPNTSIAGSYFNWVYGTQWVPCHVLAPAGEPNSVRAEAVVCVSAFGDATVKKLLVNGVEVPYNNSDVLFTWRYVTRGGRSGALCTDAIFNKKGDPHGSLCVVEFVVPAQLAQPGSTPTVQALVTSGPILNCYEIANVASGVVTFTGPNWSCAGGSPFKVLIVGNSNAALNGLWGLSSWTGGNPGTITLSGTTASGSGGGVFFVAAPDLHDLGDSVADGSSDVETNTAGPAANLPFALMDLMCWGNTSIDQFDPASIYKAAQIAARQIDYEAADGSTKQHAQFKASFSLQGSSREVLAAVMTGLRNAGNLMVSPSSTTGKIQFFVRQTLAEQQASVVSGSNYDTAVSSVLADGTAANGHLAYLFNESNIEEGSFRIVTSRIESTPNMVSFGFQNEYNGYQQDSLTEINPLSYAYSGNQEIGVPVSFRGIPNFDQGTRQANVQLAETLFGNPRNDPGGTLYFEFTVNQRVVHLASRLGYICGLQWRPLSIGTSAPQMVRVVSLKPDSDGNRWQVRVAWHNDTWYTYAFGQNPEPFLHNYLLQPEDRPPLPWHPGQTLWASNDPLWPARKGFNVAVDTSSYPAQLSMSGSVPIAGNPTTLPPIVPLQGSTGNTGGSITAGTYFVAFSPDGMSGPVSKLVPIVIPAGTSTNKINIGGIEWRSGAASSIKVFIGTSIFDMHLADPTSYTGSSPDANGNPTEYEITAYTADGLGMPDQKFYGFLVEETGIVHGGAWGAQIASAAGAVLTFTGVAWTTNQWAGRVLSLYYRSSATQQPALNLTVVSNTATTLTMSTTGFLTGDVVVMRSVATTHTSTTIGDSLYVNSLAPSGLTVDAEIGNMVLIIDGTGSGQPARTIRSNTSTVLTVDAFDITPDSTSVFIILRPEIAYRYVTSQFTGGGTNAVVAKTPAITENEQSLFIRVSAVSINGERAPVVYQPFREVYVPDQNFFAPVSTLDITYAGSQGQQGVPFVGSFVAIGGVQPYTYSIASGSLPTDLSLDSASGALSGTPTTAGSYTFTGRVTDDAGTTSDISVTVNIASPSGASLLITPSSCVGVDLGHGTDVADTVSRLVSFQVGVTLNFSSTPNQYCLIYLSKDNGSNWLPINWYLWTASGAQIKLLVPRPDTAANWKVAAVPGTPQFDPTTLIANGSMPAGTVRSSSFAVAALTVPTATLGTNPTAASGAGGSFPYNQTTPDGYQYWSIPSVTIALSTAYTNPNAWVINVTCTDIDASGNVIGPEQHYGVVEVVNGSVNIGDLIGEYGTDGGTYVRKNPYPGGTPTNLCKVRYKFYASNRVDQTSTAFSNPAASTLQTDVGSGAGYLDVTVAVGGAVPSGALVGSRVTGTVPNATNSTNASNVPWSGVTGSIDTGGGGSAQVIQSIKDASGNTVAWFGKKNVSGVDYYGIWGKNFWVGGTDPTNPKAWIDGSGNLRLVGSIEAGSSITVSTSYGDVKILPGSPGILLENTSTGLSCIVRPDYIWLFDTSGNQSFLYKDSFSLCKGRFEGDSTGVVTKYANVATAGVGLHAEVYNFSANSQTLSNGASGMWQNWSGLVGEYEVLLNITTNYVSGVAAGNVLPVVNAAFSGLGGFKYPYDPSIGAFTAYPASAAISGYYPIIVRCDGSSYGGLSGIWITYQCSQTWSNASFNVRVRIRRIG